MRAMKLLLSLVLLLVTTTAFAEEELRAPPTLRDAAKAHFHDGLAFYRSEQYGPAIVEFRASWELSGERDLLSNLSWACERAGRIPEAKEYAAKYRDLSRGTEDAERSERRMKFLTERYPDGKPGDAKPAQAPPSDAKPAPTPSVSPLTAQIVQSGDVTPSNGPTPAGRPLAIGLVSAGGATLALALGLGAGAIATWVEADRPETYYDRWVSLNTTSRALTISAAVSGVTGASLLGAGLYLMRRKR
jgi:hypothetical protein